MSWPCLLVDAYASDRPSGGTNPGFVSPSVPLNSLIDVVSDCYAFFQPASSAICDSHLVGGRFLVKDRCIFFYKNRLLGSPIGSPWNFHAFRNGSGLDYGRVEAILSDRVCLVLGHDMARRLLRYRCLSVLFP